MGDNYQRLFYIFQNMENNLGRPTGYIKVEINGRAAKLQISLSNMNTRPGLNYRIYGISANGEKLDHTVIADIESRGGRADIRLDADRGSIGSNRLDFEDINVFALIAEIHDQFNSIVCPLVAYRNGQVQWRQEFEAALRKYSQAARTVSERREAAVIEAVEAPAAEAVEAPGNAALQAFETDNASEAVPPEEIPVNRIFAEELEEEETEFDGSDLSDLTDSSNDGFQEQPGHSENSPLEASPSHETDSNRKAGEFPDFHIEGMDTGREELEDASHDMITSKFDTTLSSMYTPEKEGLPAENDIISNAERNFREISSIAEGDAARNELDIDILKEELNRSFEVCSPFNNRSKRFKWWKINSPGYLNNILFRNNVKTYLLFNPKVMLAHYKYRYIIFGIRYDKYSGRERFVCGVPGVYSIDDNPFGSMGSWAQLEGYKPKYGAFGYWIILIDPRTGKLIKLK